MLNGIELQREYVVVRDGEYTTLSSDADLEQGELVRVNLFLDVPADRHFVVVDDVVPGAIEPVNRNLATDSDLDAEFGGDELPEDSAWFDVFKDRSGSGRWFFYHREVGHKNVRFYADFLPAGSYRLHWVGQVIGSGEFTVLPAHAEEMYQPSIYGNSTGMKVQVSP